MKKEPLDVNDELYARARLEEIVIAVATGVFTKESIEPQLSALNRVALYGGECEECEDYRGNPWWEDFKYCPYCGRLVNNE